MKAYFFRKKTTRFHILFVLILSVFVSAYSACGNPEDTTPTPTPGNQAPPQTSYLVIPLTSGAVSPISACSYDLLSTVTTIQIYDSTDYDILNGCFAVIDKYEKIFSRTLVGSEVYNINHSTATTFTVSDELKELLTLALQYGDLSGGAFDVSIAPLSSLWDFTDLDHKTSAPAASDIQAALSQVDYSSIRLEGNTLTFLKEGMQLEFGAIAKGFIADKVKEYLLENGVQSAIINLGGNVLLVGEKPDGSAFKTGVQKPFEDRGSVVVAISQLKDVSMVSSGIYERYFYDETGNFYHHILNPDTGYPCENNLLQVTIISETSAMGDALSTTCFALGLEKGMDLIHSLDNVYAVFITMDGTLHFSNGYLENIPTQTE